MKLSTTRFGEIEVQESSLFEFLSPILGYEDEKKFILIEHNDSSKFKWLQSFQTPSLAFVVTNAGLFGIDYSFELPDATQEELGIEEADDLLALNIVVIPHANPRNSTINLLAPIIANIKTNKASQIILPGSKFEVEYPLFENEAPC
jgi:flagellar assembly factor FliW